MITMKTNHRFSLLTMACLGALLAPAHVLAQDNSHAFGGVSFGQSRSSINAAGMTAYQLNGAVAALTVNTLDRDRSDSAYRIFLGYQFNRFVGVEAGFFNLGKFSYRATTNPSGSLAGETKIQGGGLDLVGTLPLSDSWSMLGRVGGQYAKTRNIFSNTGTPAPLTYDPRPSSRQFNHKAGVGLQYAFTPNFLMRGEAEQYRIRDAIGGHDRVQVYSLSLVVPFGAGASTRRAMSPASYQPAAYTPPPQPTPAPVSMAQAAPPAPVMAAPQPAPAQVAAARRSVSFSAESLFAFDKAVIRPEGRQALDNFARDVAGTQFQVVVVEGHADRIGTEAHNLALSLQRAQAVTDYLVTTGGMDAAKISTKGVGEASPSKAGECKANLPGAQLRACLQPDRRVDVGVTGTR